MTAPSPPPAESHAGPGPFTATSQLVFAVTTATCLAGTSLELVWAWQNNTIPFGGAGYTTIFEAGWPSLINQLFYFTTLSNVLLGMSSAALACRPATTKTWVHVARVSALINIAITGVVFNLLLADDVAQDGLAATASFFQHVVNPVVAWVGFVAFGPFGRFTRRHVIWAASIPLIWIVVSLVRGALFDWYPYDFMDVSKLGYLATVGNLVVVMVGWVVVAAIAIGIDYLRRPSDEATLFAAAISVERVRRPLVKVVYFDEQSASDYLDIASGGSASTQTEHVQQRSLSTAAKVSANLRAKLDWLPGLGTDVEAGTTLESSRVGQTILSKTMSNTILTDYLAEIEDDDRVVRLRGYEVSAPEGSAAYMKAFTPLMRIMNTAETGIDLGQFDQALESARGYYELLAKSDGGAPAQCVLRFNIASFRNNYSLGDLSRMRLTFHAIHVGGMTKEGLKFEAQMGTTSSDGGRFTATDVVNGSDVSPTSNVLDVYDVLLAGVEHDV